MTTQKLDLSSPKLLKGAQAEERYGMCWNTLMRVAQEAGAIVRLGRSVRFNATRLDSYFDSISGEV